MKLLLAILIVAGGSIALFLFAGEHSFDMNFPDISGTSVFFEDAGDVNFYKSKLSDAGNAVAEGSKKITTSVQEIFDKSAKAFTRKKDELVQSARTQFDENLDDLKEGAFNAAVDTVREGVGIDSSGGSTNVPSSVGYVVKVNALISFSIGDSFLSRADIFDVVIDWGDGIREEQSDVPVKERVLFSHAWINSGSYDFQLAVTVAGETKLFIGSVVVVP